MLKRLGCFCDQAGILEPGSFGLVAFSGGGDSLTLLALLAELAPIRGLSLRAVHIDHGIRPESGLDGDAAETLAARFGVPFERCRLEGLSGPNLQEKARQARLTRLLERAEICGAQWVALGHTLDDQAETVLMRLIRGAGTRGLAAMKVRRGRLVRPLLWASRKELAEELLRRGLEPVRDPSNEDLHYFRSRVRHVLLPLLERENPGIRQALDRLATTAREDDTALEETARRLWDRARVASSPHDRHGELRLAVGPLAAAQPAVVHRVISHGVTLLTGSSRGLERKHLLGVARLLETGGAVDLPGLRVECRYSQLVFGPRLEEGAVLPDETCIEGPGTYRLTGGRELVVVEGAGGTAAQMGLCLRRIAWPVRVRSPRPGDRIAIQQERHRRVSRILIDAKIERRAREGILLVVQDTEVLAIIGLRLAFGWRSSPGEPHVSFSVRTSR